VERSVPLDIAVRDRATVLAALDRARALAADAVSEALGLEPALGGVEDPRWFALASVGDALDGYVEEEEVARHWVEVALWPHQTALLTAGDVPPGVSVYAEPDAPGVFRRAAPFAGGSRPARPAASGARVTAPREQPGRRTPLEFHVDLSEARHRWQGDVDIDSAYQVLAAAAEARARTHDDAGRR
jgi:hypothetical protein